MRTAQPRDKNAFSSVQFSIMHTFISEMNCDVIATFGAALLCAHALYFVQGQARDRDALPQLQPSHQHPRRGQGAHSALTCQHNNVTH